MTDSATGPPAPSGSRWPYAVSGALAALAGAGVGHLAAALVAPEASPVIAVGSTVIDATPTPVKEWAVSVFGTGDKVVLLGAVGLVTLAAAAGIGLLARRRRTAALVALVGLAALATLAALTRPAAGPLSLLPGLLTGVVGLVTLNGLATLLERLAERGAPGHPEPGSQAATDPTRRTLLLAATGAGVAAAAGGGLGQLIGGRAVPSAVTLPAPSVTLPPLPRGLGSTISGLPSFRTPNADFYRIDTALILPRVDPGSWQLIVDGDVDQVVTLSFAELLAMPLVERDITLMCVSNEVGGDLVGSTRWLGVRTRDVLARAGVQARADQVLSTSVDGMTISTPIQALTDDREALLAVAMDGVPLPVEHGFPVRLVTPGLYGFVGATKWLARMTVTTYTARQAYWTQRGWATDAPVLTESRIDAPQPGSSVKAGATHIGGVAWAQGRGIKGVEVRVDDGQWQQATLGPDAGIDYWRQWYVPWQATTGRHTLTSRATDGLGDLQTVVVTDPYPRGATGWPGIDITVG